jgi:uncharacterized protein YbaP (TraB family)
MPRSFVLRLIAVIGLSCAFLPSWCLADGHHIFWEVKGRHNTLYLLGSVHMLKPDDSALPPEALRAYTQSKTLVMELDLNGGGLEGSLAGETDMALLPEGQTLSMQLGPELYAKFKTHATAVGLDTDIVEHFQPWFAAVMLEQFQLGKAGFDASSGVDMQFAQRAQVDGKPIIGLETMTEQLSIFSTMSVQQQREFLRSTLDESDSDASETEEVVQAWKNGDTARLERLMRAQTQDSPELYRKLTVDRNRKWLPRIEQMLHDDDNYLVIVGALHLIGRDGVIDLLEHQGYTPVQH